MISPEHDPLPLHPGSVPASLRDAFTHAEELRRVSSPEPLPGDDATDLLIEDVAADEAQLTVIEQLLGSQDGIITLAHLVAARSSSPDAASNVSGAALPRTVSLAFAPTPSADRRRRIKSILKPVLLAASLTLVAGTSWYVFTLPPAADQVRAAGSAVELLSVPPATTVAPITLAWKGIQTASRYRVEILDANDDPVFATETNATSALVPRGTLRSGVYRWWVRSRAQDGSEIRSRVEKLIVR